MESVLRAIMLVPLLFIAAGACFFAFLSWMIYLGKNPAMATAIALFAIGAAYFHTDLRGIL